LDKKIELLILMIFVSGGRFPRGGRWAYSVASRSAGSPVPLIPLESPPYTTIH